MRVEWNVGIGDGATTTAAAAAAGNSNTLLLPDVRREGNGEISIPFGETALMQQPPAHSNANYFACPTSTAVLSSHSNGTSTHSASSTVGFSREQQPQTQQVTISSQHTPTPGLVLPNLSSSVEHPAEQNNSYKGIFLVDGLGHGVRIDNSNTRIGSPPGGPSTTDPTTTSVSQCGLPTLVASLAANEIHTSSSGICGSGGNNNGLVNSCYPPNPVCIQINANNSINSPTHQCDNSPIMYDNNIGSTPIMSHPAAEQQRHVSSVIPVRVTYNNDIPVAAAAPVNNVPKTNSNVADFSFSTQTDKNNTSLLLPFPSSTTSPSQINNNISESVTGPIRISSPHPSPNTVAALVERTLISTEAQTEDLPVLVPPPLPQRNREQRKRERRERRRDASHQYSSSHNHHDHNNASTSISTPTHPSQSHQRHSNARDPNHLAATLEEFTEISNPGGGRNSALAPTTMHNDPSNNISYALRSNLDAIGLPDLLNSHLPPPYSTLPQHCDRRPGMGTVPITMISPHPVPLLAPPPILAPSACLQPPPQPVRYHFSPTNRASRRSMRATRGLPYASEEEPKSCCGMSTSQAVSIRWFIIVIAVIGICCTVAGTALGATRTADKERLTVSLLMIGVGVVLLTVSAVAWRLTANETGTSCRAMLGFARSGSSRGDGGAEPNRRFVPRLAPSYGRPHHPYAAMMYPDFQYRPPPPSYQASMQEYRLRLLLLERSNPTIAAAASLASPTALTMFPPPPAYRPYNGVARPQPTNNRNDADYSRPPSYRSRSSGNSGAADGNNAMHSAIESGNGQLHIMMDSPHQSHHSRDPSLISYLSQQSILENGSGVSGSGGSVQQGGNHNVTTTVVTVMQTVSVGMGLELDMSTLTYDPNTSSSEHPDDNKDYPNQGDVGDSEKKCLALGNKSNVNSNDGNLVRIVQTTDSSQVIGRDSVIVTVSGSNHSLWSQALHHPPPPPNNDHSNTPNSTPRNNLSENGEVQILAHL